MGPRSAKGSWPPPGCKAPRLALASARLTPQQRAAASADYVLQDILTLLDEQGPRGDAETAERAAAAIGVSRTTLWRHLKRAGIAWGKFIDEWRHEVGEATSDGFRSVSQATVAERIGLRSAARLRALFVRWTGRLPTGRLPRRVPRSLFAGVC